MPETPPPPSPPPHPPPGPPGKELTVRTDTLELKLGQVGVNRQQFRGIQQGPEGGDGSGWWWLAGD